MPRTKTKKPPKPKIPPELSLSGVDLKDKYVLLLNDANWSEDDTIHRVMRCTDGFGCSPRSLGSAVFAKAVSREYSNRYDRGCFERLATDEEVAAAQAFFERNGFEGVRKKAERGFALLLNIDLYSRGRIRVLKHKKTPQRYRALMYTSRNFAYFVVPDRDVSGDVDEVLAAAQDWQTNG